MKSVIVSAQPSHCSQSVLAAGGINAVLEGNKEDDSICQHANDTWNAGCQLADRKAVERLTDHAPKIIDYLQKCGVIFSRDDKNQIEQRYFGGQQKKRTCYSHSGIGKQMINGLEQKIRYYCSQGLIRILDHSLFLAPIIGSEQVQGAVIVDAFTGKLSYLIGPVIAASGGINQVMGNTTGSIHSDGSLTAAFYTVGVRMANLEMIQYHPTTIRTKSKNILVSEAARGEGGRLFSYRNGQKWYFCEEWYGEKGNLMPRDVVSRAINRVLIEDLSDDTENVWLDMTHLGEKTINEKLTEVRSLCLDYLNLDPVMDPIPVVPGVHYFMGGIWVDCNHRTSQKGLYAAGECCYQYHGANRLGGNSTLGAIYGGMCVADSVYSDINNHVVIVDDTIDQVAECELGIQKNKLYSYQCLSKASHYRRRSMQNIMQHCMGISRNKRNLCDGLRMLSKWLLENTPDCEHVITSKEQDEQDKFVDLECVYQYQTYLLAMLGIGMIQSALKRKESRGAHFRTDYPQMNPEYETPTIMQYLAEDTMQFMEN